MDVSKCVCHTKEPKTAEAQEKKQNKTNKKTFIKYVFVLPVLVA